MKVEIIISIALSVALVIFTAAYTIINFYILRESKETRKQKTRPLMIAYLKLSENHQNLLLIVKNVGEGLAKNVKVRLIQNFNRFGRKDLPLSEDGIFKYGFSVFPPQYELCYTIYHLSELDPVSENKVELEIIYENMNKDEIKNSYLLAVNQVIGQGYTKPPDSYIGQIPYYLNEIKNILNAK